MKLYVMGRPIDCYLVAERLYAPVALQSEVEKYPDLLKCALWITAKFVRNEFMISSIVSSMVGSPRVGSHARKESIDVAVIADFPSVTLRNGRSAALDNKRVPNIFMAKEKPAFGIFAEGDHYHCQITTLPGVFICPAYRPLYKGDLEREQADVKQFYQVMPNGEHRIRSATEIFHQRDAGLFPDGDKTLKT